MGGAASTLASHLGLLDSKKYFIDKKHFDLLRSSWLDVEQVGSEKIGMEVFKGLFLECPETLITFVGFADDPAWETSKHFRHHCKVFINVVGTGVKSFDKPDTLIYHLEFLGSRHVGGGITTHHFDVLHNHFLRVLESFLTEDSPAAATAVIVKPKNEVDTTPLLNVIESAQVNDNNLIDNNKVEQQQQQQLKIEDTKSSSSVAMKRWSPQHKEAWSELYKAMAKVLMDHMGLV